MARDDEVWFDEDAGPLVRPYAVIRGRTEPDPYGLDLITLVVALSHEDAYAGLEPEKAQIMRLCQQPMSVAEVSALLSLPLAVVKLLLSDLIEENQLIFRTAGPPPDVPEPHVLQAVLDGIRRL